MRFVTCKIDNITLYLLYDVAAMFALQELYIDEPKLKYIDDDGEECERCPTIFDVIMPVTLKAIKKLFQTAAILAEQGEMYRRYAGYESDKIIELEKLYELIPPKEYMTFKEAVINAIILGCQREIISDDIDLAMEEIRRKNSSVPKLAEYYLIASVMGVSIKELMFECPGVLNDFIELKNKNSNPKKQEEGDDF